MLQPPARSQPLMCAEGVREFTASPRTDLVPCFRKKLVGRASSDRSRILDSNPVPAGFWADTLPTELFRPEGECILLYTVDRCRAVYCRPAVYRCRAVYLCKRRGTRRVRCIPVYSRYTPRFFYSIFYSLLQHSSLTEGVCPPGPACSLSNILSNIHTRLRLVTGSLVPVLQVAMETLV